jgi:hypothetical protein
MGLVLVAAFLFNHTNHTMNVPTPFHAALLSKEEVARVFEMLGALAALQDNPESKEKVEAMLAQIAESSGANYSDEQKVRAAAYMAGSPSYVKDGEVEIDEESVVSFGEYVFCIVIEGFDH